MQRSKRPSPMLRMAWRIATGAVYPGCTNERLQGIETGAGGGCNLCLAYGTEAEQERNREYETRIDALRKLSPEEQKEADTLYHQGSDLGYKSIAELKNKNQAESDRLRAEANKAYAASTAIQQAHLEKVLPQIRVLQDEQQAATVSP